MIQIHWLYVIKYIDLTINAYSNKMNNYKQISTALKENGMKIITV